jgi:hypothetical protein
MEDRPWEKGAMRGFILTLLITLIVAVPAHVRADQTVVFFPPNSATCVNGSENLLVWDGLHNVFCLPVPICRPNQILFFDGHALACTPNP